MVSDARFEPDLQSRPALVWRLDPAEHAPRAALGIGAKLHGGRWSPMGLACVYGSLDAASATVEIAAHTGFEALVARPHVLTCMTLDPQADVRIVRPDEVTDPRWLEAATPSPAQQAFGHALLAAHAVVVLPSAVAQRSWTVLTSPALHPGVLRVILREPFGANPALAPAR